MGSRFIENSVRAINVEARKSQDPGPLLSMCVVQRKSGIWSMGRDVLTDKRAADGEELAHRNIVSTSRTRLNKITLLLMFPVPPCCIAAGCSPRKKVRSPSLICRSDPSRRTRTPGGRRENFVEISKIPPANEIYITRVAASLISIRDYFFVPRDSPAFPICSLPANEKTVTSYVSYNNRHPTLFKELHVLKNVEFVNFSLTRAFFPFPLSFPLSTFILVHIRILASVYRLTIRSFANFCMQRRDRKYSGEISSGKPFDKDLS